MKARAFNHKVNEVRGYKSKDMKARSFNSKQNTGQSKEMKTRSSSNRETKQELPAVYHKGQSL